MPMNVGTQPMLPPTGHFGQDLAPRIGGPGQPPDLMSLLRQIAAMKGVPVEYLIEELERRKKAMAQGQQPVGAMGMGGSPGGGGNGGSFMNNLTGGGGGIADMVAQAMAGTKRR